AWDGPTRLRHLPRAAPARRQQAARSSSRARSQGGQDTIASMRPLPHLVAFFGHHKCASTWVHSILAPVCAEAGWKLAYLYDETSFGNDLAAYVRQNAVDVVSYVNADARFLKALPPHRAFHVVRDPRDLTVSAYFSHRNSHPTRDWPALLDHRARLQKLDKDEGLLAEMEFDRDWIEEMG